MISAFRLVGIFLLATVLYGCSNRTTESAKFVGSWNADEIERPGVSRAELVLRDDGAFSATAFPASLACPELRHVRGVAGSGTWKLNADLRRIDLNFLELSGSECTAPYLANVFPERGLGGLVIVAYPDGVDNATTAIQFKLKE